MIHGKYVEVEPVILSNLKKNNIHVYYFCGGRGIGKTYGAMDMLYRIGKGDLKLSDSDETNKFLYLRTTEVEAASIANPAMNPFKIYNKNEGTFIRGTFNRSLGLGEFYEEDNHLGYAAALSTFQNLRGVDFSDVILVFYDEVISESKRKRNTVQHPGTLFLNLMETINRNRALEGKPEIIVVMCSNPIDLGAPILSELNLTSIFDEMIFKGQYKYTDVHRSLHISRFENHTVSIEKEEKSMLYKFSKGLNFNEQAISGKFTDNNLECIKKFVPLQEYTPKFTLENYTVYQHKSDSERWYITRKYSKSPHEFKVHQKEFMKEIGLYWEYKLLVANGTVYYDNYQTRTAFNEMIGLKTDY